MLSVVGRDSELAAIESFLAAELGFATLVVVGEPGIGKTTVWEEALARARRREPLFLVARPTEVEARLSFAALWDILAPTKSRESLAAAHCDRRDRTEQKHADRHAGADEGRRRNDRLTLCI